MLVTSCGFCMRCLWSKYVGEPHNTQRFFFKVQGQDFSWSMKEDMEPKSPRTGFSQKYQRLLILSQRTKTHFPSEAWPFTHSLTLSLSLSLSLSFFLSLPAPDLKEQAKRKGSWRSPWLLLLLLPRLLPAVLLLRQPLPSSWKLFSPSGQCLDSSLMLPLYLYFFCLPATAESIHFFTLVSIITSF